MTFGFDVLSEVESVSCSDEWIGGIEQASQKLGYPSQRLISGAAHDAQIMGSVAPVGMIFVPSVSGRSHSAAEWTHLEDIEAGANVALHAVLAMAELESSGL